MPIENKCNFKIILNEEGDTMDIGEGLEIVHLDDLDVLNEDGEIMGINDMVRPLNDISITIHNTDKKGFSKFVYTLNKEIRRLNREERRTRRDLIKRGEY